MFLEKEKGGGTLINWKVRFQNKSWITGFISQILIVLEMVLTGLNAIGVTHIHLTAAVQSYILTLANALLILLSMLGIIQDPTTKGYADSEQALTYEKPK